MSELKPCPFCGGEAQIDRMGTNKVSMQISCGYCGAYMESGETWIDENSNWNQRVETETEKRLTSIATKHATRADELYEALESTNKELYFLINEVNKYRTKDVRCDQLDPPELYDMETCHLNAVLLDKSRIEAEKGDGICN